MSSPESSPQLIVVNTLPQAMRMRSIRNQCREFMTRDQRQISFWQQVRWFYQSYRPGLKEGSLRGYLFGGNFGDIGYGFVVKDSQGDVWLTGGLKTDYRGLGYGRLLFGQLIETCEESDIWLEVLTDNLRAERLYKSLGFTPTKEVNRVTTMRYAPDKHPQ